MSFYSEKELADLGLKSFGENVLISKKSSIYGAKNISIGNNVRIDDFSVLSGKIVIGNYVHIACSCLLFAGDAGIELKDFCGLSSKVSIYAVSDDYSGDYLTNPTVPDKYKKVDARKVMLGKHVIVGSGSTILPNVSLAEGVAVGAMSLVTKSFNDFQIIAGNPARFLKKRKKNIISLEEQILASSKT